MDPPHPRNPSSAPVQLTPRGRHYARDLDLSYFAPERHFAAWVESGQEGERVCVRVVRGGVPGDVTVITPSTGAPDAPRVCGTHLLWLEQSRAQGVLMWAEIIAETGQLGPARPVAPLLGHNCGDFACVLDEEEGALWLLVETWLPPAVGLRLFSLRAGSWHEHGWLGDQAVVARRPQLCAAGSAVFAAWDQFAQGRVGVVAASASPRRSVCCPLTAPPDAWESLPSLAIGGDRALYVARCREVVVVLGDGVVNHHSALVLSALPPGSAEWRDLGEVEIDHAMNPWMAAYMGRRRFPFLVPRAGGVWLLWEEREDAAPQYSEAQRPFGRLCAAPASVASGLGDPRIAIAHQARFVVERHRSGDHLLVASKTQQHPREQHLPYHLHHVCLDAPTAPRPGDLASNRAAPRFVPRPDRFRGVRLEPEGLRLFFGDPHLHSRLSQDLDGEQDELYHFAREVAGLDFAAFTENDFMWCIEPLSRAAWHRNCRNADLFYEPGCFTTMVGWEYTREPTAAEGEIPVSHRSVLFPGNAGEVCSWGDGRAPTPRHLAARFAGTRTLLHHHQGRIFDVNDDTLERNVEVCSGWENYMLSPDFRARLHAVLQRGFRLGFFGASDNHERNPGLGGGLAGVWATENTREAIFEAFWRRRIFGTSGLRCDLRFRVSDTFMGGELTTEAAPRPFVEVRADVPVEEIDLVRDGERVHAVESDGYHAVLDWVDAACPPGEHFYYAQVRFAGAEAALYWNVATAYGRHAWSSPVWVRRM